ncbi:MAG: hypothetical protein HC857_11125 [Synechococcales cyanobacterium RU_4_20]|nr:hypothetical protein [Synechococcales cyanobacterium RU_4_20]NJR68034.1 hypothetical protein [Synechococcales cyanobacterium CRU_2_2]
MSDRLSDRLPLHERIREIKKILTLPPRDTVHSAALLVQLGQHMLSEAELAALPADERMALYQSLETGIQRLKDALDLAALSEGAED